MDNMRRGATYDEELHVSFRLLGRFDVCVNDQTVIDEAWPRAKARALLKLAVLAPGRRMRRCEAEALLWPDLGDAAAANNVRKNAHYLRTVFSGAGIASPIAITEEWITVSGSVSLDLEEFELAARQARASGTDLRAYEGALALYKGDLAADELDLLYVRQLRDRLAAIRADLLFELAELHLARADYERAIERLQELLSVAPAYEEAHCALMRLHAWRGQEHLALRQYVECQRALRNEFDVAPSESTVALHEAIRERRLRTAARPAGQFVGREQELAALRSSLADAIAGSGSVVAVAGEPGIGKTRLAQEFAHYAHLRGAMVVWTYCRDGGADPPFQPWIRAIGGVEGPAGPAARDEADDGRRTPVLARLVGRYEPSDGVHAAAAADMSDARRRMFEGVVAFFRQRSRSQPLVIIVDDLHDAQVPTLRLLEVFSRELHGSEARILIVGCHRETDSESVLEPTLTELGRQPRNRHLTLRGLPLSDVKTLVSGVQLESSAEFIDAVSAATGGSPLAIQEIVRLVSDDLAAGLRVPATLSDITAERLEGVSDGCRRRLSAASVIGMEFDAELLEAVGGWHRADVVSGLREASRRQLLQPCEGTDQYRFSHAVIRDALYDRLQVSERSTLHQRVAEKLESALVMSDKAELLPDVARHYGEAARAGGDVEKAIEYATRAAEAATQALAWEQTIDHLKAILELMESHALDAQRIVAVLERLHELISSTGAEHSGGLAYLERAASLRERLGQEAQAAQLHYRLAQARSPISAASESSLIDVGDAILHYRLAEPVLARTLEGPALGYFYISLGVAAFYGMQVEEAQKATARALEIAERADDELFRVVAEGTRGIALKLGGHLRAGREYLQRCWEITNRRDDQTLAYLAATNLADWHEGYLHGGGEVYERELARPWLASAPKERAGLLHDLGAALCLNGRLAEARRLRDGAQTQELGAIIDFYDGNWERTAEAWERDHETFAITGNRYTYAARSYLLAEVYLTQGRHDRAEDVLRASLATVMDGPCALIEMRLRPVLALLSTLRGRLEESRDHIARCRALMAEGEDWGRRAGCVELASGMLAAREGRHDQMESYLCKALDIFIERCLPWCQAETLLRWAQAAHSIGNRDVATKKLDEARSLYLRISAGQRWLERLGQEGVSDCWVPVATRASGEPGHRSVTIPRV